MVCNDDLVDEGVKYDSGKLEWHRLPLEAVKEVVKCLQYGANKYPDVNGVPNWKLISNGKLRYYNAAVRHLFEYAMGNKVDDESGELSLAHCVANLLFVLSLDNEEG